MTENDTKGSEEGRLTEGTQSVTSLTVGADIQILHYKPHKDSETSRLDK